MSAGIGTIPLSILAKTKSLLIRLRRYWFLYVLLLPITVYYVILRYYPMFLQVMLSFKEFRLDSGIWGSEWVGFANFMTLFSKAEFLNIIMDFHEINHT